MGAGRSPSTSFLSFLLIPNFLLYVKKLGSLKKGLQKNPKKILGLLAAGFLDVIIRKVFFFFGNGIDKIRIIFLIVFPNHI